MWVVRGGGEEDGGEGGSVWSPWCMENFAVVLCVDLFVLFCFAMLFSFEDECVAVCVCV